MSSKIPRWTILAIVLWASVLIALFLRAGLHPARPTSLATYLIGGRAWVHAQPLYTNWRGFVYPPVIGWFFGLFTHLPPTLAALLWRALASVVFLFGLGTLFCSGVFHRIPIKSRGLVYISLLPLSVGNIDNAQANPLIAGLMMISVASTQSASWTLCAAAIGLAVTFKVYPAALALLLGVLRPRQLAWRILLVVVLLAALPLALQNPHYVSSQYDAWLQTRMADDRFHYPMKDAPLDLWYLLVRLCALPLSERLYTASQILGGTAIAAIIFYRERQRAPTPDTLAHLYLLVTVWMLLLGPATENQTYVILAPAACLLAVQTLSCPNSPLSRVFALAAYALLLAAVARNSLFPHLKNPWEMALQPIAALLMIPAILAQYRTPPITSPVSPQ